MPTGGGGSRTIKCVLCEEAAIQQQCKLCNAWLYCSRECCKKDTKKHKKVCPSLALATQATKSPDAVLSLPDEVIRLHCKHLQHVLGRSTAVREDNATDRQRKRMIVAGATVAEARKHRDAIAVLREKARVETAAKAAAVAASLEEARALKPESYGDSRYWEDRHAKGRAEGETYEWYTDYPDMALREAFPPSARGKKTLVVGCGNSRLSEKMCMDGFRDVLSIDTSESAVAQMSERAPEFEDAGTKCRYEVMDASRLPLDSGSFAAVVDKGTIDAVLSAGLEPARRVCAEAMRVLEPGGKLLVISSSPGEQMLETLLGMCGPGSACDAPLAISGKGDEEKGGAEDGPPVFAYIVRKEVSFSDTPATGHDDGHGERSKDGAGETPVGVIALREEKNRALHQPARADGGEHPGLAFALNAKTLERKSRDKGPVVGFGGSEERSGGARAGMPPHAERGRLVGRGDNPGETAGPSGLFWGSNGEASLLGGGDGGVVPPLESFFEKSLAEFSLGGGAGGAAPGADAGELLWEHRGYSSSSSSSSSGSSGGGVGGSNSNSNSRATALSESKEWPCSGSRESRHECGRGHEQIKPEKEQGQEQEQEQEQEQKKRDPRSLKGGSGHGGDGRIVGNDDAVGRRRGVVLPERPPPPPPPPPSSSPGSRGGRVDDQEEKMRLLKLHETDPERALEKLIEREGRRTAERRQQAAKRGGAERAPVAPARSAREGSGSGSGSGSPSLPWGMSDKFAEDMGFANYELYTGRKLKASELRVEIGATRLKVCRGPPGGVLETLVDGELFDRVNVGESIWSIEDKTVLSVSLCKRKAFMWRRLFKRDAPDPPSVSHGLKMTKDALDSIKAGLSPESLRATGDAFSPAPPATPRVRERSPKIAPLSGHTFGTPKNFLVEDQTGIKMLQLHLSKPRGFRATLSAICRADTEVCEVRLVCRDETSDRRSPDEFLLQRAELGRADFDVRSATCDGDVAGDVCVVRVPYRRGGCNSAGGVFLGTGVGNGGGRGSDRDPDDEGVARVARLRCRFCGNSFTPAQRGLAVRAMPSGRWDGCMEDMVCYDGPSAVPLLASEVNFADAGRCLMASAEVLLHSRDVVPESLAAAPPDPEPPAAKQDLFAGLSEEKGDRYDDGGAAERCTLQCARCDVPLGRPAILAGGEGLGFLLLKHAILGDDLSAATDTGEARRGCGGSEGGEEEKKTPGRRTASVMTGVPAPAVQRRPVFEGRTAIKWLMGEMEISKEADGCVRFVVVARGRSPAALAGCLSLLLVGTHNLVSVDGGRSPHRAHRVAFRETSREEAERAAGLEEEDKRGGEQGGKCESPGGGGSRAGRVPARVLEVSYEEYRVVSERLVGAAWASTWTVNVALARLDSRGYRYSYLF